MTEGKIEDFIRYDRRTQEALLGVVRDVLSEVSENGLPGGHHFYITFDTRHEGVRLSKALKDQYPEDMTIVVQHQFWDLTTGSRLFEIGLTFSGQPEKLVIPYSAITRFIDPSVNFGLQFEEVGADNVVAHDSNDDGTSSKNEDEADSGNSKHNGALADVVTLDSFRKKH